jgi:hypothetical protein
MVLRLMPLDFVVFFHRPPFVLDLDGGTVTKNVLVIAFDVGPPSRSERSDAFL